MTETLFMIHVIWAGPSCWNNDKGFFEEKGYNCITTTLRFLDMNPKDVPDSRLRTRSLLDNIEDLEHEIAAYVTDWLGQTVLKA